MSAYEVGRYMDKGEKREAKGNRRADIICNVCRNPMSCEKASGRVSSRLVGKEG
jgi:hypothetical protein